MAATFKMKFIGVTSILLMTSFISSINSERIDCKKVVCPRPEVMESCPTDSMLTMVLETTTPTTTIATTMSTTTSTTSTTTTTTTTPSPPLSTIIESDEDDELEPQLGDSELSNPIGNNNELSENSNSTNTQTTTTIATTTTKKQRRNRKKNKTTEEPPVKQLNKRSLRYHRRESIKIVPGDYRNFDEYFRRYYNQKWKRSIGLSETPGIISELRSKQSLSVNADDSDHISIFKECCPRKISTCVCRNDCQRPVCVNTKQILVELKPGNSSQPGQCCPEYVCVDSEPDCRLYLKTEKIYWTSKCRMCKCILGFPLCSEVCQSPQHQSNIESNCYSEISLERKLYKDGDKWKEGDCTECECEKLNRRCFTTQCGSMYNCTVQRKIRGECCPICDDENLKTTKILSTTTEIPSTTLNKDDELTTTDNTITSTTACAIIPTTLEPGARISNFIEDNLTILLAFALFLAFLFIIVFFVLYIKALRKGKKNSYLAISNGDSNSSHNNMENGAPANNTNHVHNHQKNHNHLNHQHSNSSSN